jgi:hypothetical protein
LYLVCRESPFFGRHGMGAFLPWPGAAVKP